MVFSCISEPKPSTSKGNDSANDGSGNDSRKVLMLQFVESKPLQIKPIWLDVAHETNIKQVKEKFKKKYGLTVVAIRAQRMEKELPDDYTFNSEVVYFVEVRELQSSSSSSEIDRSKKDNSGSPSPASPQTDSSWISSSFPTGATASSSVLGLSSTSGVSSMSNPIRYAQLPIVDDSSIDDGLSTLY